MLGRGVHTTAASARRGAPRSPCIYDLEFSLWCTPHCCSVTWGGIVGVACIFGSRRAPTSPSAKPLNNSSSEAAFDHSVAPGSDLEADICYSSDRENVPVGIADEKVKTKVYWAMLISVTVSPTYTKAYGFPKCSSKAFFFFKRHKDSTQVDYIVGLYIVVLGEGKSVRPLLSITGKD